MITLSDRMIIGVKGENTTLNEFYNAFRDIHKDYWVALRLAVLVVIKFFECKRCAFCCRFSPPSFKEWEAKRIAEFLGKNVRDLPLELYINVIGDEQRIYFKAKSPCPFLKGNSCSIYPIRGTACRSFPFEWLMYSLVPSYCQGSLEAIKKAIPFIMKNKDKLQKITNIMESDLRKLARNSEFKEEMRYKEYAPLVKKLFDLLEQE